VNRAPYARSVVTATSVVARRSSPAEKAS
jgi:hypothetical protein